MLEQQQDKKFEPLNKEYVVSGYSNYLSNLGFCSSSSEKEIEESIMYVMDCFDKVQKKSAANGDLFEDYTMDFELLEHFYEVNKVIRRLVEKQYRCKTLKDVDIQLDNVFMFTDLTIDRDFLDSRTSRTALDLKKNCIYNIQKLDGNSHFEYKGKQGNDKDILHEYYTQVTTNLVQFVMNVLNKCYESHSVYTVMKLVDMDTKKLAKVGLNTGEMINCVLKPEITNALSPLCHNIYNKEEGFNKASMLTLLSLLNSVVSKEDVSIEKLKGGIF
jgi:hypothetical protein